MPIPNAFEEFVCKFIAEAQLCRIVNIFKLNGNVYAFDSTAVDFCLNTFEWALFTKRKEGLKMHTSFHVTPAKVHDTEANDFQGCPILRNTLEFFLYCALPLFDYKREPGY